MKTTIKSLFGWTLSLFSLMQLIACEKDTSVDPPPPATNQELRIQFAPASLSATQVDSAIVVFSKPGSPSVTKKLVAGNNVFSTTSEGISSGTWKAEWQIFTKKPNDPSTYARQHVFIQDMVFPLTAPRSVTAPSGDWNGGWLPRVHVHDAAKGFIYIVAMDFSDPYYAVFTKDQRKLRYLYLDRIAKQANATGSALVAAKSIERFSNFPASGVTDRQHFQSLTEEMRQKNWNRGEILIELLDTQDEESTFYYLYNKQ
ncbi:MAG: hypothetical protein MUE71_11070 [Chitinophagaceae bacterium]|jgi:hypothetical protein|nr:hypothetical protein [Chitinophagaceae bacterium]MCU0405140.1 hypothetical protein [Chitinophagaceae bacterium]